MFVPLRTMMDFCAMSPGTPWHAWRTAIRRGSCSYLLPSISSTPDVPHFPLLSNFPHSTSLRFTPTPILTPTLSSRSVSLSLVTQFLFLSNDRLCLQFLLLPKGPVPIREECPFGNSYGPIWSHPNSCSSPSPIIPRFLFSRS